MRGVLGCLHSPTEHRIVAGMFALLTQTAAAQPDEWVEPMNDAEDFSCELHRAVPSADVRELVSQDDAPAIVVPRVDIRGEDDRRSQHAADHEDRRIVALQEGDWPSYRTAAQQLVSRLAPGACA